MKKVYIVVMAVLAALVMTFVPASAATIKDLIADGRDTRADVGDLDVTPDTANGQLVITFTTAGGWELTETHLHVGDAAPSQSSPGKFANKHEDLAATSDRFSITLPASGTTLIIAAHAGVRLQTGVDPVTGLPVYVNESAWSQSPDLSGDTAIGKGKNWATYFVYIVP